MVFGLGIRGLGGRDRLVNGFQVVLNQKETALHWILFYGYEFGIKYYLKRIIGDFFGITQNLKGKFKNLSEIMEI